MQILTSASRGRRRISLNFGNPLLLTPTSSMLKTKTDSQIEIELDPDKICNKLDCGGYDYWWSVLTENGSPPWITSWQNTGWAKKLSIYGKWQMCTSKRAHNVQLQWLYTAFTRPFDNLLKLICSKLPKMLSSPITIDGKPTPHMENPTHIKKMQLIAPLTVLV